MAGKPRAASSSRDWDGLSPTKLRTSDEPLWTTAESSVPNPCSMLIDGRSDPNTAGPQTRLDVHPSASAAATITTTANVRRLLIIERG
jgi:hypothetical protein